ncbi:hypothetical protein [Ruegeria atlantica]|uniref:Uncharacterized protein n=1 Tax=Ruegeria atlantica TaxID=81569 RepID=A0A0P1E5Z6_9RHOB|nr:hypothetical protein [Ruegeria atlantica]CUH43070.1 hypothetical protein RUM4293_01963 [Ruegeria atlantica]
MMAAVFDISGVPLDWQPHARTKALVFEDVVQVFGMDGIHFASPQALEAELCARGRL